MNTVFCYYTLNAAYCYYALTAAYYYYILNVGQMPGITASSKVLVGLKVMSIILNIQH